MYVCTIIIACCRFGLLPSNDEHFFFKDTWSSFSRILPANEAATEDQEASDIPIRPKLANDFTSAKSVTRIEQLKHQKKLTVC